RCPDYPVELERMVLRALRKQPEQRYATAQELQLELEAFGRERKLDLSTVALARCLAQLFGEEVDAWRKAEEAGLSLIDFMVSTSGATSETDSWGQSLGSHDLAPVDIPLGEVHEVPPLASPERADRPRGTRRSVALPLLGAV